MKKQLFGQFKKFKVSIFSYIPHRIESIWFVFLVMFGVVILAVFSWGIFLFFRVSAEDVFVVKPVQDEVVETISREQLEELLTTLERRQEEFNGLIN